MCYFKILGINQVEILVLASDLYSLIIVIYYFALPLTLILTPLKHTFDFFLVCLHIGGPNYLSAH